MRKSTKIAVVLAAAALLVAGFAFTTLAKGWVKEAEGLYYYEDEYGMKVYNEWKKDTDANGKVNYYYLGDDGYMVTNTLVESDGYYWCGADGAKVVSQWVQVPASEDEANDLGVDYRWYHFGSTGKADTGKKNLDGKTYFLDAEGKMLFGYVDGSTFQMTTDVDDAYSSNSYNYYCGSNEEGWALKSDWRKETSVSNKGAYEDESSWWAFYTSSGARATDKAEGYLWKGVRYYFEANGKMIYDWKTATVATYPDKADKVVARYFGDADDGKMVKKAWAYIKPAAGGDDKFWYFFDNAGYAIQKSGVEKINGKFYAFGEPEDYASKMLSGVVKVTFVLGKSDVVTDAIGAAKYADTLKGMTRDQWLATDLNDDKKVGTSDYIYYFSGDEANDGSMKKNITFSQEFIDDTYTLAVGNDGRLKDGYLSKKYYRNGIELTAAQDLRYEVVYVYGANGKNYALLGTSGAEVGKKATVADADGSYYYVDAEGEIFKADSSLLSAAKAIASWKKDKGATAIKIEDSTWKVTAEPKANGYSELKLTRVAE